MATVQTGIIYIDKNRLEFYGSKMPSGLRFDFPPTSVMDSDIVNKEEFQGKLTLFIEQNQIPPASTVIVISPFLCFDKDYQNIPPDQQDVALHAFLENVPIEEVSTKIFPIQNGFKIIATNKELYESVKYVFEKKGFIIEAVTPIFILGPDALSASGELNPQTIPNMFEKYNILKQNGLESGQPQSNQNQPLQKTEEKRGINVKLIGLLVFFFILILILLFMIFNSQSA